MTDPIPTDWRALCAELLDALDEWTEYESPVTVDDAVDLAKVRSLAERARAALAQPEPQGATGRPAIEPVPVVERLPGPEDCLGRPFGETDAGYCWWWFPEREEWWFVEAVIWRAGSYRNWTPVSATHWLPHHALPVPQQEAE